MAPPKGFNPKVVGDRACAIILARLLLIYDTVLLPFGENQRYDLVVDTGHGFARIQCKTGRLQGGAIKFRACSNTYHHPNPGTTYRSQHYRGEADLFGIYCPETDGVYLVPVEEIGTRAGSLRVEPARNNQSARIRWAKDYEIRRDWSWGRESNPHALAYKASALPIELPQRVRVQG